MSKRDRRRSAIYGHLVGDALGVPYEFSRPEDLPPEITMVPPKGFKSVHRVPPGTWSDDGAQMLAVLDAGPSYLQAFPNIRDWFRYGKYAVGGVVFDCGNQTRAALTGCRVGFRAAGNGSLMRTLPPALYQNGSDLQLYRIARSISKSTHRHELCGVCCGIYVLWARNVLDGATIDEGWDLALDALPWRDRESWIGAVDAWGRPRGSGYVVDCLLSAREACRGTDYRDIVTRAIRFGNDTDTTACVAGGIAALVHQVPDDLFNALRCKEIAEKIFLDAEKLAGGEL